MPQAPHRHLLEPHHPPPYLACCAHQGSVSAPDSTLHQVPVGCQLCKEAAKVKRAPVSPHPALGNENTGNQVGLVGVNSLGQRQQLPESLFRWEEQGQQLLPDILYYIQGPLPQPYHCQAMLLL